MKRLSTFILVIALGSSISVEAQRHLTLLSLESVPQSILLNPANRPDCKWFIGIPAASSISIGYSFSGLNLSSFTNSLTPSPQGSGYILDSKLLTQNIKENTVLNLGLNEEWLFAGFPLAKGFAFFNVSERVKFKTKLPEDLFHLILEGNGGQNLGRSFQFDLAIDAIHFREFGFGYSRNFLGDRLGLGVKVKYLYGLSIFETAKNDFTFYTQPENFAILLNSDLRFNMASSFLPLEEDDEIQGRKILGGANNMGWGLDLGGTFKVNEKINLFASLLDLGQIYWKENSKSYVSREPGATFKFTGIDLNDYFIDSIDFEDSFNALGDSLIEKFELDSLTDPFTSGLHSDYILGMNYQLNSRHKLTALTYLSVHNKTAYPMLHLAWNGRFGRVLGLSASYTASKAGLFNLGCGMSLNAWPFQFYLVSDNLLSAATGNPDRLNLQLGLNLTFGRKSSLKKLEEESKEGKL